MLIERAGTVLAPCGNRRATVCPACSDRYGGDAYHLLRAGLAGDDTKAVPATVAETPAGVPHPDRTLVRARAHPRPHPARARRSRAAAASATTPTTRASAPPLDPDSYDYDGAVLWQAHAGQLWAPFTIALRRALAAALGVRGREFREHARISYAKVAEYQRRGLVHFHAVIRLDGPDGPADPPPAGLDPDALRAAITAAAHACSLTTHRPDGTPLPLGWGSQLDLRRGHPAAVRRSRTTTGQITDAALAAYIAKYATKGTGASEGADRPIRDVAHVEHLRISDHHRRMITTAWQLGGLDAVRRAQPAAVGAHARLPRPLPDQVPALLDHLHRPPRRAAGLAAARRPRRAQPRHRRRERDRRPTSTPSP